MSFLAKALQGGLASGSSSSSTAPSPDVVKPEQLGSIRVAVVGEPSVGKTALTELIASGLAARSSTRSTAGCHIHVKLVDSSTAAAAAAASDAPQAPHDSISSTPGSAGALSFYAQQQQQAAATAGSKALGGLAAAAAAALGGGGPAAAGAAQHPAQRKFFVELWDVSGQPKYAALRSVFYKQLNGVILVYDVTRQASLARLAQWAAEVAADGSFVAPLADDAAALNVGGLPVPVLLVGNKADRLGFTSRLGGSGSSSSAAAFLSSACAQLTLLQGPLHGCSGGSGWPQRLLYRLTRGAWCAPPQRPPSQSGMAAAAAEAGLGGGGQHLLGLTASAAAGQVDWDALNGFLTGLWERRYQPAAAAAAAAAGGGGGGSGRTNLSGAYHHRHTLSAGVVPLPGGGDVGALLLGGGGRGAEADAADARLDDGDWV